MPTREAIYHERAMLMHRDLAEYHRTLATKSHTAISYNYHLELASRLSSEADRIQGIVIFEEESLWQDPPT